MPKSGKRKNTQNNAVTNPSKKQKLTKAQRKAKTKANKMSSKSSASSSLSTKDNSAKPQSDGENSVKAQCDLCRLSYVSQQKLTEHLVSLIHHTKLEEAEKNPKHECIVCNVACEDMALYREHIGTDSHAKKLESLRNPPKNNQKKNKHWNHNKRNDFTHKRKDDLPPKQGKYFHSNWDNSQPYRKRAGPSFMYNKDPFHWQNAQNYPMRDPPPHTPLMDGNNTWEPDNQRKPNPPWGSGAFDNYNYGLVHSYFEQANRGYDENHGYFNHFSNNGHQTNDFAQDDFHNCWNEQSFQQHEDFLASMDHHIGNRDYAESYSNGRLPPPPQQYQQRQFETQANDQYRNEGDPYTPERIDEPRFNDRKRPRYEDNQHSRFNRSMDMRDSQNFSPRPENTANIYTSYKPNTPSAGAGDVHNFPGKDKTGSSGKSPLDNASDTILERAERLCKELREKREASYTQRDNMLKSFNHESLNDKMNNLRKNQQSYLKGFIQSKKSSTINSTHDTDSLNSPSSTSQSDKLPPSQKTSKTAGTPKSKTLDEIRNSIEQSVLDNVNNSKTPQGKIAERRRTTSLGESSAKSHSNESSLSKAKSIVSIDLESSKQIKGTHKPDSSAATGSKATHKAPTKQTITKEHLNRMVNYPRSRTERVHLARMVQSREESRPTGNVTSRTDINMEGLYDSTQASEIQLDIGDSMATIKLEDLSDDVRNQILGLIQDDMSAESQAENSSSKGKKTKQTPIMIEDDPSPSRRSSVEKGKKINKSSKSLSRLDKPSSVNDNNSNVINVEPTEDISTNHNSHCSSIVGSPLKNPALHKDHRKDKRNREDREASDDSPVRLMVDLTKKTKDGSIGLPVKQEKSPTFTSQSVLSKYPTLLGSSSNRHNVPVSHDTISDKDRSSADSGISSLPPSYSIPASSLSRLSPQSLPVSASVVLSTAVTTSLSFPLTSAPVHAGPSSSVSVEDSSAPSETPSTMSELLRLSEQEEQVKQEMTMMELRLTRLHRLLEQAVHQISQCTERRNQLYEEEKNLVNKRLSLLKEVASSSSSSLPSTQRDSNTSVLSEGVIRASSFITTPSSTAISLSSEPVSSLASRNSEINKMTSSITRPQSASLATNTATAEILQEKGKTTTNSESGLTQSEWLAKFSTYLPSDSALSSSLSLNNASRVSQPPALKSSKDGITSPLTSQSPTTRSSSPQQTVPEKDTNSLYPTIMSRLTTSTTTTTSTTVSSSPSYRGSETMGGPERGEKEAVGGQFTSPSPHITSWKTKSVGGNGFTSPIMYVGTITSGDDLGKRSGMAAPVMTLNNTTISSLFQDAGVGNDLIAGDKPRKLSFTLEDMHGSKDPSLPSVPRKLSISSPRQEDSDIGSVASMASGSSLGEQISRYCRFTPGATLEENNNPHDLSVILSGPSDTSEMRGVDEMLDSESANTANDDNTTATSQIIKLKEDSGNSRLYGRLDQDSVKSAEALHLMERNNEVPSTSPLDKKKKKRKTKQQRDSGIRGRSKPYIISSSSADENDTAKATALSQNDISSLETRLRRSPESTSEGDSSDRPNQATTAVGGGLGKERVSLIRGRELSETLSLSPSKTVDGTEITVAECDSSTGVGAVDAKSLNEHTSRLKEMNESFEKNFGRKPKYLNSKADLMKNKQSSPKKNRGCVVVLSESDGDERGGLGDFVNSNVIDLCDDSDDCVDNGTNAFNSAEPCSRFPGELGSVCYLHCKDEKIFAGFLHYGFKVFHLFTDNHSDVSLVPMLSCMDVAVVDGNEMVFTGSGDSVFMHQIGKGVKRDADLGTSVKCLHVLQNTLFAGLDTGEICGMDIRSWKESHRFMCSDQPIHCLASGSEGGTRLLCVASQDSTITVVDADRCLPLRILVGHTKTAFSIQVHNQSVFSGSGDGKAVVHNLHTARVEKVHSDNKGMVNCVFYSQGHLFTGGMDRLIRCYNATSHQLVQVYYGADRGAIKSIFIYQDTTLVSGSTLGSIDTIRLDLKAKNVCKHKKCGLNFGLPSHLKWHLENEHMSTF